MGYLPEVRHSTFTFIFLMANVVPRVPLFASVAVCIGIHITLHVHVHLRPPVHASIFVLLVHYRTY